MNIELKNFDAKSDLSSPLKLSSTHSRPKSAISYQKVFAKSADPCLKVQK